MEFTLHPLPASMSICQTTLPDPDAPDAGAENEDDEEPAKSGDSSSDSEGQQSPLKSSKAAGQPEAATEEDQASDSDDQQTPASVTAEGQARAAKARGPSSTSQWKEYNRWLCQDNTMPKIMAFIRADLADLNKKAGISSAASLERQHLRRLDVPPQLEYQRVTCKIPRSYVPLLSAVDVLAKQKLRKRRANTFSTCTRNIQLPTTKRTLTDIFPLTIKILFAVKTAPMNIVAELIKNVQDSSTKQIDSKLKRSATRLIRSERAKLLKVEGDSVKLTSDVVPLKTVKRLAVKFFLKPAVQQHIACVESSATQSIDSFKTFCIGKAFIGSER